MGSLVSASVSLAERWGPVPVAPVFIFPPAPESNGFPGCPSSLCSRLARGGARTLSAGEARVEERAEASTAPPDSRAAVGGESERARGRARVRVCVRAPARAARTLGPLQTLPSCSPTDPSPSRRGHGRGGAGPEVVRTTGAQDCSPLLASLLRAHLPAALAWAPSGRGGVGGRSLWTAPLRTT